MIFTSSFICSTKSCSKIFFLLITLMANTFLDTLCRTLYTFPNPPTPILELAKDSKSSFLHSRSSPLVTDGERNNILFLILLTLSLNSAGISTGFMMTYFFYLGLDIFVLINIFFELIKKIDNLTH